MLFIDFLFIFLHVRFHDFLKLSLIDDNAVPLEFRKLEIARRKDTRKQPEAVFLENNHLQSLPVPSEEDECRVLP